MQYKHISKEELRKIEEFMQIGKRSRRSLGKAKVRSDENWSSLTAKGARSYEPMRAQKLADKRRKDSKEPLITERSWRNVFGLYKMEFSPEQIASVELGYY